MKNKEKKNISLELLRWKTKYHPINSLPFLFSLDVGDIKTYQENLDRYNKNL